MMTERKTWRTWGFRVVCGSCLLLALGSMGFVIRNEILWREQREIARIESALESHHQRTPEEWVALRLELIRWLDDESKTKGSGYCFDFMAIAPPEESRLMWLALMEHLDRIALKGQEDLIMRGWEHLRADPPRLSVDETSLVFRETRRWILESDTRLRELKTGLDTTPSGTKPGMTMLPRGLWPSDFRKRREIRADEANYRRRSDLYFQYGGLHEVAHRAARRFRALPQTHPALDAAWRQSFNDPSVSAEERARLLRWLEHGPSIPELTPEDYERQYGQKPRILPADPWKE